MKFNIFLLLVSLQLISPVVSAQDIIQAYIITLSGDSVMGQVQLPGDKVFGKNVYERLNRGVDFRAGNSGSFKWYPPNDLKEFGWATGHADNPWRRYVSEKMEKNNRLLIIEVDGPMRLLKDYSLQKIGYNTVNVSYFFLKKGDGPLFAWDDDYYTKRKKRSPLKEFFKDCPALSGDLEKKVLDDIDVIVRKHNQLCK